MKVNNVEVTFTIRIDENTEVTISESQARLLLEKLSEVFGFELKDGKDVEDNNLENIEKILRKRRDRQKEDNSQPDWPPYTPYPWQQPVWVQDNPNSISVGQYSARIDNTDSVEISLSGTS